MIYYFTNALILFDGYLIGSLILGSGYGLWKAVCFIIIWMSMIYYFTNALILFDGYLIGNLILGNGYGLWKAVFL